MPTSRRSVVVTVLALGALSACGGGGGSGGGPATAGIYYTASATSGVVLDSVQYDDGHGTLTHAAIGGSSWSKTFSVTLPASVQAHLFAHSTAAGSIKIGASWSTANTEGSDSTTTPVNSAAHFQADIPHHSIQG